MSNELQTQSSTSHGRWTKQEHDIFLAGLRQHGRNWKEIAKMVGTRTGAQIRSHAQKYFERGSKSSAREECSSTGCEAMLEKSSNSAELMSVQQEETNVTFSYYFTQISKMVGKNNGLCFWTQLIGVEEKDDSRDSRERNMEVRHSFMPYGGQRGGVGVQI